jgi:hypothetical protein
VVGSRPPEPGLTPGLPDHRAVPVHEPCTRLVREERTAVVGEANRLAEREGLAVR